MPRLTASLVIYKSDPAEIAPLLRSLAAESSLSAWVVVDNDRSEDLQRLTLAHGGRYIHSGANLGFGAGHNLGLRSLADVPSDFHLLVNPDITFAPGTLAEVVALMDRRPEVGLVMPRVLSPQGQVQSLCKLLPRPADLGLRRFAPAWIKRLARSRLARYEMQEMDLALPANVPFLSGCFMFLRRAVFESIGGFDEGFFLYMEDVDLCRRMGQHSRLLYWPEVAVTHVHQRGSHTSVKLMLVFVRSAIRYFNKWGWLLDPTRRATNRDALAALSAQKRPSQSSAIPTPSASETLTR